MEKSAFGSIVDNLIENPKTVVLVATPLGPVPYSFEDVSPFCHLDGPDSIWSVEPDQSNSYGDVSYLGLEEIPITVSYTHLTLPTKRIV